MKAAPPPRQAHGHHGLLYGALGWPLAFVALPLFVLLPDHYGRHLGLPLTTLAGLLLGSRLLDAILDPWIGRWVDRRLGESPDRLLQSGRWAVLALAAGFTALFFPPQDFHGRTTPLAAWCLGSLVVTYTAYSFLVLIHQAWGAKLGGDESRQVTLVAWREGCALVGVLSASVLPSLMGLPLTTLGFVLALGLGWFLLGQSPRPSVTAFSVEETNRKLQQGLLAPWKNPEFQKLLSVFLLNGIAMAIPANLVIFFLTDRLKSPDLTPAALSIYFGSAALATPAWARLVKHLHLIKCWVLGMGLSVVTFAGAALLSEGDRTPFLIICALSGVALGADLALPAALLTGVIQKGGDQSREGAYFGWWNFANKLNLALAAGICLPILSVLGYQPGEQDPQALQALSVAYCAIPCLLKVCALCLLYRLFLRPLSNGEHQS